MPTLTIRVTPVSRDAQIARAAEKVYALLRENAGPTADWPIDVAISDPQLAREFLMRFNELGEAIDPLRNHIFDGVEGK